MRTLYFDIGGTVLCLETDRVKQALAGGMFEVAIRQTSFEGLVCVSNFARVAHFYMSMGVPYDALGILFRLCKGAFADEHWLRSVTLMVSDPEDRGCHIDLAEDWWYVDDLADHFLVQAGLQDVLDARGRCGSSVEVVYHHDIGSGNHTIIHEPLAVG